MNAYAAAPGAFSAYKESSVLTAPPERLVLMLYDGIHRFLTQSAAAMRGGDLQTANTRMQRAEAIIDELMATLDHSAGQVADRLNSIYLYSRRTLGEARIERNPDKIDHVNKLLGELREAWAQICASGAGAE
ncbi:MAG: flagellar secretion chaperone FliS [Thermoleophilaceae bacterium]|jgi:flagellar protein FliS|nr:flagellar secretion chaperone FliS [Thermoleophilaceae bacterium]